MSESSLFHYYKLEDIAKDNKDFLMDVTKSYIQLIGQFKEDYEKAANGADTKLFQEVTHRVKGSLRFMEAQKLLLTISLFRAEFYQGTHTPTSTRESISQVNLICDQILKILEEKKSQLE